MLADFAVTSDGPINIHILQTDDAGDLSATQHSVYSGSEATWKCGYWTARSEKQEQSHKPLEIPRVPGLDLASGLVMCRRLGDQISRRI